MGGDEEVKCKFLNGKKGGKVTLQKERNNF